MATGRQTDVSLVIRARDEASKAVTAINGALNDLLGTQKQVATGSQNTATGIAQVIEKLAGLDKAYSQISGAAARGSEALDRQASSLAANKTQLAALEQQSASAGRAVDQLSVKLVDALLNKVDAAPLRAQISSVKEEMTRLDREAAALQRTITSQETGFKRSASTLAEVERQTRLVGAVETFARQQADEFTKALERQGVAAARNAQVLRDVQSATDRSSGKSAADSAEVFRRVGLTDIEKEIAATEAATRAERDRADAVRLTEAAMRARARIEGNGGSAGSAAGTALAQQLRDEEAAAQGAALAEQELAAAAAKLRSALNPMAAIQANLNTELAEATKLYRAGKISAEELAQAELLLKKNADLAAQSLGRQNAGSGKPSLFGLKPYELQNLSFQVNDIFTQLASGTSLTQTLAQQGGQLLQIFPQVGSRIIAAFRNPYVAAFAVTLGTVVVALKEVGDQSQRIRTFVSDLAASADGNSYGADKLNDAAEALDRYGLSAKEAVEIVRVFTREGIRQDLIESFGEAAKNLAEVMGVDLKQAAKEVADAFSGGYDAIKKLDESYNFLTASQRENIRSLFEEGRAAEARTQAFDIFSRKQEDAAQKARGPWASAFRELGAAWQEFVSFLADLTVIKSAAASVETLAGQVKDFIHWLRGVEDASAGEATGSAANSIATRRAALEAELRKLVLTANEELFRLDPGNAFQQRYLAALQQRIKDITAELTKIQAAGGGDTINADSAAAAKARADRLAEIDAQRTASRLNKEMDGDRRIAEAGRLAFEEEMRKSGDIEIAQAQRNLAIERETREVTRDRAEQAKSAAAERERAIQQFNSRVIGAEGGAGKNPHSTAKGFGQFLNETWLDQFRKVFADESEKLSRDQILALRQNSTIAKAIIDNYARENAKFLEGFGAKVTAGNLYLAHFLGAAGAKKILTADPNTTVDKLLSKEVISANKGYLAPGGRPRTAGGLVNFIAGRVGDTGAQQSAGQVEIAKLQDDAQERQDRFNLSIEQENAERQRVTATLTEQNRLQDTALLAAQKRAAVEAAEAELRERVARQNESLKPGQEQIKLTEQQIAKTRELAAAEFDARNARTLAEAERSEAERGMAALEDRRSILEQQLAAAMAAGDGDMAEKLRQDLIGVNSELATAIQQAKQFWTEVLAGQHGGAAAFGMTAAQIENVIGRLDTATLSTQNLGYFMGLTGQQISQTFTNSATNAIDSFAQAVGAGANVFESLRNAFLQFAADFLRQIAQMIIQQLVFNAISGFISSLAGGGGKGTGLGAVAGLRAHDGGVVGMIGDGPRTGIVAVNPAWFQNARRYHSGGIAGLQPDEVPAILQRGEEVLRADNPRHRNNAGGGESLADRVKVVNVFNPADVLQEALGDTAGQKVVLNHVRNNPAAWRAALGL